MRAAFHVTLNQEVRDQLENSFIRTTLWRSFHHLFIPNTTAFDPDVVANPPAPLSVQGVFENMICIPVLFFLVRGVIKNLVVREPLKAVSRGKWIIHDVSAFDPCLKPNVWTGTWSTVCVGRAAWDEHKRAIKNAVLRDYIMSNILSSPHSTPPQDQRSPLRGPGTRVRRRREIHRTPNVLATQPGSAQK